MQYYLAKPSNLLMLGGKGTGDQYSILFFLFLCSINQYVLPVSLHIEQQPKESK